MPFINHIPLPKHETCTCAEHDPPKDATLEPGKHTWKCPECGTTKEIYVPGARSPARISLQEEYERQRREHEQTPYRRYPYRQETWMHVSN